MEEEPVRASGEQVEAFILHEEGKSYAAIGEQLGVSEETAMYWVDYVQFVLKRGLQDGETQYKRLRLKKTKAPEPKLYRPAFNEEEMIYISIALRELEGEIRRNGQAMPEIMQIAVESVVAHIRAIQERMEEEFRRPQ